MKRIKRMLSVALCATMIAGMLTATVYADNVLCNNATERIVLIEDRASIADPALASKIQNDLETLGTVGITVDALSVSNISEAEPLEYVVSYSEDYVDYIRVSEAGNGTKIFSITENDIVNTIAITSNGEYYIDGQRVVFSETTPPEAVIASAHARATEWAKTPFVGAKSDYTIDRGLYKNSVIDTVTTLCDLATSSIQMILAGALDIDNVYNVILDTISLSLKIRARETAPTSHYLSCTIYKYEHNSLSYSLNRYYMYQGNYYPTSSYSGTPVTGEYYEHNYFF